MKIVTDLSVMSRPLRVGQGFSPNALFDAMDAGLWFDPSDRLSLFRDTAGTIPVSAVGQAVARINDKTGNGVHATQPISAARPIYRLDSGGRAYLEFDGVDDFLATATLVPGSAEMQLIAGVRKLATAGYQTLCELSGDAGSFPGTLSMLATSPGDGNLGYIFSQGTIGQAALAAHPPGANSVLTGLGDIGGDQLVLRIDGSQVAQTSGDQGSGTYQPYPVYIGMRAGNSIPFNGRLYGLVLRFGSGLSAADLAQVETFMGKKTGMTL